MIAGVPLEAAIGACTNGRRRPSSEHDLRRGLAALGFRLAETFRDGRDARAPIADLPSDLEVSSVAVALVRLRTVGRRNGYHWIVVQGGTVFDPSLPTTYPTRAYEAWMYARSVYASSWATVLLEGGR